MEIFFVYGKYALLRHFTSPPQISPHGALFQEKHSCRIIAIPYYFPSLETKKLKET